MGFVENNTSAIVTLYLIVNSVDVQMIYWKLQTEHESFNAQAEKKGKRDASEYLGFVLLWWHLALPAVPNPGFTADWKSKN